MLTYRRFVGAFHYATLDATKPTGWRVSPLTALSPDWRGRDMFGVNRARGKVIRRAHGLPA